MGGRVRGGVGLGGGQGGWERRSEACVKIQKKKFFGGGVGWGGGGQGGCEWRSEAFAKIQRIKKKKNKNFGGGGVGSGGGWLGGSGWMGKEN